MRFWKYQGIGNDFVLLDGTDGKLAIDADWCRRICDRHYGVGADGVLYVMPGESTDITMRIINADGSEAEMCGNGIRCVAKHAYDFGIVRKESFSIHTLAGDLKAEVKVEGGKARTVRIDMGAPILEKHPFFPRKTNVEFCRIVDGKIHIRVYERGAAWTLACGTGACATTTAAALQGLVPFGEPVDVHLPGGWLRITVDRDLGYVLMEGPAELVFEGTI